MSPEGGKARQTARSGLILIAVFLLLLAARILGSSVIGFVEGDEAAIALRIMARLSDVAGGLYRHTGQLGHYRFVEALSWLMGGAIPTIPLIMKGLSCCPTGRDVGGRSSRSCSSAWPSSCERIVQFDDDWPLMFHYYHTGV